MRASAFPSVWLSAWALMWASACVSTRPLSPAEARELGAKRWDAPTDEVFDATWLSLAGGGYAVKEGDRLAGTLVAHRGERTWEVEVAALGAEQRVLLAPRNETSHQELVELLDVLEAGTATLLRAWRDLPEWKYDGRKNLLKIEGYAVPPPPAWEWLDFDINRRRVVVQQKKSRAGVNPTLLVEVDRRRPDSQLAAVLKRAAALMFGTRQRLVLPEALGAREDARGQHGTVQVQDGTLARELVWHAAQQVLGPSEVHLMLVCPRPMARECQALWADVVAGLQR